MGASLQNFKPFGCSAIQYGLLQCKCFIEYHHLVALTFVLGMHFSHQCIFICAIPVEIVLLNRSLPVQKSSFSQLSSPFTSATSFFHHIDLRCAKVKVRQWKKKRNNDKHIVMLMAARVCKIFCKPNITDLTRYRSIYTFFF